MITTLTLALGWPRLGSGPFQTANPSLRTHNLKPPVPFSVGFAINAQSLDWHTQPPADTQLFTSWTRKEPLRLIKVLYNLQERERESTIKELWKVTSEMLVQISHTTIPVIIKTKCSSRWYVASYSSCTVGCRVLRLVCLVALSHLCLKQVILYQCVN